MTYSALVDALSGDKSFSERALPTTKSLLKEISVPSTASTDLQAAVMDITKDELIQKALAMQFAGRRPELYKALDRQLQA